MPTLARLLVSTGTAMSLALIGGVALTTPDSADGVADQQPQVVNATPTLFSLTR